MRLINLLPKTEQREIKLQLFADQLTMFWIWALVSLVFSVALTYTAKIYLNGQVTEAESQITQKRLVLKDNEKLKQQVETINSKIVSIKSIQAQHYYWSAALNELARILPQDMIIDSLIAERGTGVVTIEGISATRESVLKFWADMHKSEYFTNIDFPLANLNLATDDPYTFTFSIVPETLKNP